MNRDSSCIVRNFYASRGLCFVLLKLFILCSALSMSFEKSCARVDNVLFSFVYLLIVKFLLTPSVHILTKPVWLYNRLWNVWNIANLYVHITLQNCEFFCELNFCSYFENKHQTQIIHSLFKSTWPHALYLLPKMPCRIPMVPPLHPYLSTIKHGVVNRPRICIAPNNK